MNWKPNRREFLAASAAGLALGMVGPSFAQEADDLAAAYAKARHRKRRIIMNNDGNDVHSVAADEPKTVENFLSKRTTALADSQVDSIFYCTGVFNYYMQRTDEAEVLYRDSPAGDFLRELFAQDIDPLQIIIDWCREHDREVFWSMRMNDTHDSDRPDLFCQWKTDHPEYLVGKKGTKYRYGCNRWSSVDYGLEPVRDKVFRILEEVASRYDVDGLELDFFRHPVLFRAQMTGEPVTDEQRAQMTGLMRRIHAMTRAAAKKHNHPVLVAIRVPDSVAYLHALGIDLETWLKEGLVDVLVAGGYFHMTPWDEWAAMAHKYNVPTYACFVSRRLMGGGQPEAATELEVWRGEAFNAWEAGMDGVYTFNRFNPEDTIFRELGDPDLLRTLPRVDQQSFVADIWSRPETWLKDGRKYVKEAG